MADHTDNRSPGASLPEGQTGGSVHSGAPPLKPQPEPQPEPEPQRQPDVGPDDDGALGPEADAEKVARKIILDQLTGQARSRAELAIKLAKKDVPDEVAERLLTRFEEVGLIDDAAFARSWVESRQSGKGLARRALAHELRRKGIDDQVARDALDEVDPEAEVESARMLVRRKMRSVQRVDRNTAIRRLTAMLARKGYPPSLAIRVVREQLEAVGHDADDVVERFD